MVSSGAPWRPSSASSADRAKLAFVYRRSAKPAPTTATVSLYPTRGRSAALGVCVWTLVAIPLLIAARSAGEAVFEAGHPLSIVAAIGATLLAPLFVWRVIRHETLWLGAESLRVAGVLFDRSMKWSEIAHVERFVRRRRNASYPVIRLESSTGRKVELSTVFRRDPTGALRRALDAVRKGDLRPIEPMVRAEATARRPLRGLLPQIALSLTLALAGFLAVAAG